MNSPLLEKSMDFATQIVLFYEEFSKSKKDTTIAKQLLRSLQIPSSPPKRKVAQAAFSFCTLHSSLFTLHFSLNLPHDFSREEIREKREKTR